jgi:phosphoglycerate dehydrogenase-like enzyme
MGDLVVIDANQLNNQEVIEQARGADIILAGSSSMQRFSSEIFENLPKLKFVSLTCVGTDWVDLKAAEQRQIPIATAKGANAESVAEHSWGMMLDLSKRITEADRDMRSKSAYSFSDYPGREVYGKTLGIVGLGAVGKKIARIAAAFDMKILAYDLFPQDVPGVEWVSLEKLCRESDLISISVSLTEVTKGMIGAAQFSQMKNHVILVNVAREPIVEKEALLETFQTGKIGGYGLETPISTKLPPNDPYFSYPQIVITPHTAFNTLESRQRTVDCAIENIQTFMKNLNRPF